MTEDAIAHRGAARGKRPARSGRAEQEAAHRLPPERAAGASGRYSPALQIVRVLPILVEAVVVVVSTAWIVRAVSGVLLVAGTAWTVHREHAREMRTVRGRRADREIESGTGDVGAAPSRVPDDAGGLLREMYRVAGARGEEIVISIRLRPTPSGPDRHRRRPPRRSRTRPGR